MGFGKPVDATAEEEEDDDLEAAERELSEALEAEGRAVTVV